MGYIDCDAHVWETDATWDHLLPTEQGYRPAVYRSVTATGVQRRSFVGPGWQMSHGESPLGDGSHLAEELAVYPAGTRTLANLADRLAHMDSVGVDVQICHSTGWTHNQIDNPDEERALARSYNRWIAGAVAGSGGRLRWQVQPPMASPAAVVEELRWGKEHGAVGVNLTGHPRFQVLTSKAYYPVWEAAQELGLVCVVHAGQNARTTPTPADRRGVIWNVIAPVPGALFHLLASDFSVRFPGVRWLFAEAGAMWVPWIVQQFSRAGEDLWRSLSSDWQQDCQDLLAERNVWLCPESDDDVGWLLRHVPAERLVLGTGYGHFDMATDLRMHSRLAAHPGLDADTVHRMTSGNAADLFDLTGVPA